MLNEIEKFVEEAEEVLSADAKILWNSFKTIWATFAPSEWAVLQQIIKEAIADGFDGDFADLEQKVVQKLETAGVTFASKLASAEWQAVLALFVKGS